MIEPVRVIRDFELEVPYRLVAQGDERFIQVNAGPAGYLRYTREPIISTSDPQAVVEFNKWLDWKLGRRKDGKAPPLPKLPCGYANEEEFLQDIKDKARLLGWITSHTRNSKGSDEGLPDLILRRERLVWAELKMPGKLPSSEQQEFIDWLNAHGYEAHLWYPSDMDNIIETLTRKVEQ